MKWPPFFLQTEVFTKRPLLFHSPHQMTPYFSFVLTERPPFSLFSLSPKDPYFWGRVRTYPSLPYVSAPPPESQTVIIYVHFDFSGQFSGQTEAFLGTLAFAKGLDRTLIIPPFILYPCGRKLGRKESGGTQLSASAGKEGNVRVVWILSNECFSIMTFFKGSLRMHNFCDL